MIGERVWAGGCGGGHLSPAPDYLCLGWRGPGGHTPAHDGCCDAALSEDGLVES